MSFTKEELAGFLDSDLWKEIEEYMVEEKETAKEELSSLDFSNEKSNIQAVKIQAKIESIDLLIDKVQTMKEESAEEING